MTLEEAKEKFLHKECDVSWAPLDRKMRDKENPMLDTIGVYVTEIYRETHGELFFRCANKLTVPFDVRRLKNPR